MLDNAHAFEGLTSEDGANSLSSLSSRESTAHTTQTPSPHRFLAGEHRQTSPSKEAKAPSALRRLANQRSAELSVSQPPSTTTSQFVPTPRFSAAKQRYSPSRQLSPPQAVFVDPLQAGRRDEMAKMQRTHRPRAMPAVMTRCSTQKKLELYSRQKVMTTFELPRTPASHFRSTVPRFSHPSGSIASTAEVQAVQHRPSFLRSSVAPSEPSEPLPEAFSPHRRGQKFVPGGMAATMQQWVIETGQAAVQSRRGHAYLRGEDYVFKAIVEVVEGDGPYLVRATTGNGEVAYVMLAAGNGERAASVVIGSIVGLRAPTWAVECEGRVWRVGVDWKVL
ncbi:hypothetical protein LTS02_010839 [Friedmanniomyces endolithicus]|nr:hypothetical protein LTS02_010839 [Friedmanniomyces endolithicus]